MVITLDHVVKGLHKILDESPSTKLSKREIDNLHKYTRQRIFVATGTGFIRTRSSRMGNYWDRVPPGARLMAKRSAEIDAYRKMGERLKGVRISSNTIVKDFIAESDEIRSAFNSFIRGGQFIGKPRYKAEGVVEVTLRIRQDRLIQTLSRICESKYYGMEWQPGQFRKCSNSTPQVIQVVGTGVPPRRNSRFPAKKMAYVPDWATRTLQVTGIGSPPAYFSDAQEAAIVTIRAAEHDAYRQLTIQIMRLKVRGSVTIRDYAAKNRKIQGKLRKFIEGARKRRKRFLSGGRVELKMELSLDPLWQIISRVIN